MKLVCYIKDGHEQLAMLTENILYDMDGLHPELPSSMSMFLNYWNDYFPLAKTIYESIEQGKISLNKGLLLESVNLISPVPFPSSYRRAIVTDGLTNTGFNSAFHFLNHHCIQGPGEVNCMQDHFEQLDFEISVDIVVSTQCRNITAEEADECIGGYMIMNRIIKHNEPYNNNVANVLGPWLVTPDELEPFRNTDNESFRGNSYSLQMTSSVNDKQLTETNLADMNCTFAEILESCAYGANLMPGDIIGTGSVIMGCYSNLNQKGRQEDPAYPEQWLQKGDILKIEIEGLGISTSTIVAEESEFSLARV